MSDPHFVYHFTDTARLPWILSDGELRPGRNRIGGFPAPDFVWSTSSSNGDRTASGGRKGYQNGVVRLVRLTLDEADFVHWSRVPALFPQWRTHDVVRLEASAAKGAPGAWWCRSAPLPRDAWLAIETKAWGDGRWRPLPLDLEPEFHPANDGMPMLALGIEGELYASRKMTGPQGQDAYQVSVPVRLR